MFSWEIITYWHLSKEVWVSARWQRAFVRRAIPHKILTKATMTKKVSWAVPDSYHINVLVTFHCLQSVCLCCRTISAGSFPVSFATSPWIAPWTTIADPCLNLRTFEHVFTLCPTKHCFCQEHKTIGIIVWRRAVLGCWFALWWISLLCSLCVQVASNF